MGFELSQVFVITPLIVFEESIQAFWLHMRKRTLIPFGAKPDAWPMLEAQAPTRTR
jgi:hypothetical protein